MCQLIFSSVVRFDFSEDLRWRNLMSAGFMIFVCKVFAFYLSLFGVSVAHFHLVGSGKLFITISGAHKKTLCWCICTIVY